MSSKVAGFVVVWAGVVILFIAQLPSPIPNWPVGADVLITMIGAAVALLGVAWLIDAYRGEP